MISSAFAKEVYKLVAIIPKGKIMTYKGIARKIGRPKAVRAVGNVLKKNRDFAKIPCHRVVCSDGRVGGYVKGINKKEKLLRSEGVEVRNGKIDIEKFSIILQ